MATIVCRFIPECGVQKQCVILYSFNAAISDIEKQKMEGLLEETEARQRINALTILQRQCNILNVHTIWL